MTASRALSPLFFFIAKASKHELARQIEYLKAENQVLRARLPRRIVTTPAERALLVRKGRAVGAAIRELVSIVSPRTFTRWLNRETAEPVKRGGRPRARADIEALVIRIARETGFGYTRILGELRKLGIDHVCRTTVKNILDRNHLEPTSSRRNGSWDRFIRSHAESLWACDFFTKNVWTPRGLKAVYVLFALQVGSRRVRVLGHTEAPDAAWMVQRGRELRSDLDANAGTPQIVMHDRDTKFTREFCSVLEDGGHAVLKLTPYSPNLNGHAERWIQSVKRECLDHFVVFGEDHLDYLLSEYEEHYNTERPHSGCSHMPPEQRVLRAYRHGKVRCQTRLGGTLRHYCMTAA